MNGGSARAGRLSRRQLSQMVGHVPGPELDHVAAGVGDVGCSAATVAVLRVVVIQHRITPFSQPLDNCVVSVGRQPHRIVHVNSATASAQSYLRPPQTDASPVGCHHPNRLVRPALDHREAQDAGVELFSRLQIALLERDLDYTRDWNTLIGCDYLSLLHFGAWT
jgi:hypothetical protein